MLSRFSRVQLCVTLQNAAPQAPLSMGFSRQEYWSGLPCPPPGDLPDPGIKPRSPTLLVESLPSEPAGKPENTGVGSLSLLQGIFPTQKSIQGVLCCRWILYQLSYQRSPSYTTVRVCCSQVLCTYVLACMCMYTFVCFFM